MAGAKDKLKDICSKYLQISHIVRAQRIKPGSTGDAYAEGYEKAIKSITAELDAEFNLTPKKRPVRQKRRAK